MSEKLHMTCRELFEIENPGENIPYRSKCPHDARYKYIKHNEHYCYLRPGDCRRGDCVQCWDQEVTNQEKLEEVLANHESSEKTWAERIDENLAKANCVIKSELIVDDTRKVTNIPYIPDEDEAKIVNLPYIKDSGERREFETGAVRDIQEGKGRCDLMPLDVVAGMLSQYNVDYEDDEVINAINNFKTFETDDINVKLSFLYHSLYFFCEKRLDTNAADMILDVAKHFEAGAVKYGENNWQKGIPVHCYIDSAVRHYLKFLRGDDDEPHDRAFVWNIMCCIWTCVHKPELNDFCEVKVDE